MRRSSDKVQFGINLATIIALAGLLYSVHRNSYTDLVKAFEAFEARVAKIIDQQNDAIEKLRERRR